MKRDEVKQEILAELLSDRHVQEMKRFKQHGRVTTFDHCLHVANLSYSIDKWLFLHSDLRTLLTGAVLHDFFLYDWHESGHSMHGFTHPKAASKNARKYFSIDDKTGQVIESHMWPLTFKRFPRSREAWVVCLADKCVSLHETLLRR